MNEFEKKYLLKEIPRGLENCDSIEIIDIYVPKTSAHPTLRVRKNGDKYEITKKTMILGKGHFNEETVHLTAEEFKAFRNTDGKVVHKIRYLFPYEEVIGDIDVFQGELLGLITAEFEHGSIEELDNFSIPHFCLADVTGKEFTAGGFICGKSFDDIKSYLDEFGYKKLFLN